MEGERQPGRQQGKQQLEPAEQGLTVIILLEGTANATGQVTLEGQRTRALLPRESR